MKNSHEGWNFFKAFLAIEYWSWSFIPSSIETSSAKIRPSQKNCLTFTLCHQLTEGATFFNSDLLP